MDNKNDNMQTITYQGQQIEVEPMGETGGYMGRLLGRSRNGIDELYRDLAGRYYLRRERFDADRYEFQHEAEATSAVFARAHAVNVNAAILWAISHLGSEGWKLRCDAANLLAEGRGYTDPQLSHLSAERLALMRNPDRLANGSPGTASRAWQERSGPVELDTHVTRLLRSYAADNPDDDPRDVANGFLASMLESALFDRSENSDVMVAEARQRRLAQDGSAKTPTPGRIVVELNDLVSAMLRRVWQQGNSCREAGEDPRDLVNAAVTFAPRDDSEDRCGEFDLNQSDDALARAKSDRLSREKEVA